MAKKTKKATTEATTQETTPTTTAPVDATPAAPAVTQPTETKPVETKPEPKGSNVKASKSTVQNPVQVVRETVKEMKAKDPNVRRKDLMAACLAKGASWYTARTQIQIALKKMKEPATVEAK